MWEYKTIKSARPLNNEHILEYEAENWELDGTLEQTLWIYFFKRKIINLNHIPQDAEG
jgi:hypothetical protein